MGGAQSTNVIANRWEFVSRQQDYNLVRDKSGREGEEYDIPMRPDTVILEEFGIYSMRKTSPQQIVSVYGCEMGRQPGLCTPDASFRVITEHLSVRFSQSFLLNVQEALYFLAEAVKGLEFLYSKVGCFAITGGMLGLTAEGEVKVWMHELFGQNSPQLPKNSIRTVQLAKYEGVNQEEDFMVRQIFEILQSHTPKEVFQKYINSYKDQILNFRIANKLIIEIRQKFHIPTIQRIELVKRAQYF